MSVVVASIPTRRVEEVRARRNRPLVYDLPTLPEPWVVRPWGRTGWYEARTPAGGHVMLRRLRHDADAYVCSGEPRDLRGALQGATWCTVEEAQDPRTAPESVRPVAQSLATAWPDDCPRDDRGDLVDPAEPVVHVRHVVAGRDMRADAVATRRETVESASIRADVEPEREPGRPETGRPETDDERRGR